MKIFFKDGQFYNTAINGDAIPADAIEISEDEWRALCDGQHGREIIADENGMPVLKEPVHDTDLQTEIERRWRDAEIKKSDHLIMPDYPIDAKELAAAKAYRQALRDYPGSDGFPFGDRPKKPEWMK